MSKLQIDIITILPDIFTSFLNQSLIARAIKKKLICIKIHNLRDFTNDKHQTVDDRPFGGGVGMVLMAEPIYKAIKKIKKRNTRCLIILMSAKGKTLNQDVVKKIVKYQQIIIICGRYEGVDERVAKYLANTEISIGDYVLFGGEVPAMVVTEAVSRLVPEVIAKKDSVLYESFQKKSDQTKWYIEHPQYTRPENLIIKGKKRSVPKTLLSGHHLNIKEWKEKESQKASIEKSKPLKI